MNFLKIVLILFMWFATTNESFGQYNQIQVEEAKNLLKKKGILTNFVAMNTGDQQQVAKKVDVLMVCYEIIKELDSSPAVDLSSLRKRLRNDAMVSWSGWVLTAM